MKFLVATLHTISECYKLIKKFMKMSLTMSGILVAVIGTILTRMGFSDICSNEIVVNAPLAIGSVMAWWGRIRMGDVNIFGVRK